MKQASNFRLPKAAVAAVVGCSLLLGGGTYALWTTQTSVASQAAVTTGDLKATALPGGTWTDVTNASSPTQIASLTDYRIAPGSSIQLDQNLNVVAIGDNLNATLHVRLPNTTGSQALLSQAKFTLKAFDKSGNELASVTPTTNTLDSLALDIPNLPKTSVSGDVYRVQITVAIPSSGDNATKLQAGSLANMQLSLEQNAPVIPPKPNPTSDFTFTTASNKSTVASYVGTATDVVIPSSVKVNGVDTPVTTIGTNAFQAKNLTSVVIPDTVTDIGAGAFQTNKLTNVQLPSKVAFIRTNAFQNNLLTSVELPSTVTSLGSSAFAKNLISSLKINEGLAVIGSTAFSNNKLSTVTLPNSVTIIGSNAFEINSISSINLGSGLQEIDNFAFNRNAPLGNVTFPSSLKTVGLAPFDGSRSYYFTGNAPTMSSNSSYNSLGATANNKVFYKAGKTGFTNPWYGYTTATY